MRRAWVHARYTIVDTKPCPYIHMLMEEELKKVWQLRRARWDLVTNSNFGVVGGWGCGVNPLGLDSMLSLELLTCLICSSRRTMKGREGGRKEDATLTWMTTSQYSGHVGRTQWRVRPHLWHLRSRPIPTIHILANDVNIYIHVVHKWHHL